MDEDFLSDAGDRGIVEVPIVPILDMMVAIIFFLLISTTYFNYTSQTLPQSKNITINDPKILQPSTPKLLIIAVGNELELTLRWDGPKAGQKSVRIPIADPKVYLPLLESVVFTTITQFLQVFPNEKSVQLGLSADLPSQVLISSMDAITRARLNIVLLSYDEVLKRESL